MPTRSIKLITTQKVLNTWSVKGMKQHYLGSNQSRQGIFMSRQGLVKAKRFYNATKNLMSRQSYLKLCRNSVTPQIPWVIFF